MNNHCMQSKYVLSLLIAQKAASAIIQHAGEQGWCIALSIVDDGGHPLYALRADRAAPISSYIAHDKARTAAIARRESKIFEEEINTGRVAFLSAGVNGCLEGGVPLIIEGSVIGAIGVAGVKPEQASLLAHVGAEVVAQYQSDQRES